MRPVTVIPWVVLAIIGWLFAVGSIRATTPEEIGCEEWKVALRTPRLVCCCYDDMGYLDNDPTKDCDRALCRWTLEECPAFSYYGETGASGGAPGDGN